MNELREYQFKDATGLLIPNPRSLLLYEPRMGKTPTTSFVLNQDRLCKKIVVSCPTNAYLVWEDHVRDWITRDEVDLRIIEGDAQERHNLWVTPSRAPITVFIANPAVILRDFTAHEDTLLKQHFDTFIFDEYHKWLMHKTKTWKILRTFCQRAHRVHGLSGTPLERGPYEFWPVLYLLDHIRFKSRTGFEDQFCLWNDGWHKREYVGLKNPEEWFKFLWQYARVRFRKHEKMPSVTRSIYHYSMTLEQEKVYRGLDKNMFHISGDLETMIVAANTVEKNVRLRQLLACPAILDEKLGVGGAMNQIIEDLAGEEDSSFRHVVIYSFFREALPHFERALRERLPGISIESLHGGLATTEIRARIDRFKRSRGIMLCTTSYAQAFDLSGASACYHVGWSYSPNDNKQAEDRIIPQVASGAINSYYAVAKHTVEEELVERVDIKNAHTSASLTVPEGFEAKADSSRDVQDADHIQGPA